MDNANVPNNMDIEKHAVLLEAFLSNSAKCENSVTLVKEELMKKFIVGPNSNIVEQLKSVLEDSVSDISPEYLTSVKRVFSMIDNYIFPRDFVHFLLEKDLNVDTQ